MAKASTPVPAHGDCNATRSEELTPMRAARTKCTIQRKWLPADRVRAGGLTDSAAAATARVRDALRRATRPAQKKKRWCAQIIKTERQVVCQRSPHFPGIRRTGHPPVTVLVNSKRTCCGVNTRGRAWESDFDPALRQRKRPNS